MSRKSDPWVRRFDVSESSLHPKGYTIYKIVSTVFPKNSPEAATEVIAWRRYSEIKRLHKALRNYHINLHLKGEFPDFPNEKLFGRFEPSVIEERRQSTLQLLEFVALNPPLFTSQIFVKFFENNTQPVTKKETEFESQNEVLEPIKANDANQQEEKDLVTSENSSLSGVWQYPQPVEEISSEDSKTDDDSEELEATNIIKNTNVTFPISEVQVFDPFSPAHSSETRNCELSPTANVSNAWLLSALTTCSSLAEDQNTSSSPLLFPQAFADYEENEILSVSMVPESKSREELNKGESLKEGVVPNSTLLNNKDQNFWTADAPPFSGPVKVPEEDYSAVANHLLTSAKLYETKNDFHTAFDLYKRVIEILLNGIKQEINPLKRNSVRCDVARYLSHAEKIYEYHLNNQNSTGNIRSVSYSQSNKFTNNSEQLGRYKVLGIVGKANILTLDCATNLTYVIKVLSKSVCSVNRSRKSIFHRKINHMVELVRYHETDDSIFLVLQYASGGKLWNFVGSYLQNLSAQLTNDDAMIESGLNDNSNVYVGKKFEWPNSPDCGNLPSPEEGQVQLTEQKVVYVKEKDTDSEDLLSTNEDTRQLVFNSQKLLHDVDETLRDSDKVLNGCISLVSPGGSKPNSPTTNDATRQFSPSVVKNSAHPRLRGRKASEEDPFSIERTSPVIREGSGSVELRRTRIRHFSSVFHQLDTTNHQSVQLPESNIRIWASEIIKCVWALHRSGLICKDLRPDNVLLDDRGHILLTYFSQWLTVDDHIDSSAKENLYIAPEIGGIDQLSSSCDWWSIGALLYELFTGKTLSCYHEGGFNSHTQLYIPTTISVEAESLLKGFLCYNPNERLGSGPMGVENIKAHPFFYDVDWS